MPAAGKHFAASAAPEAATRTAAARHNGFFWYQMGGFHTLAVLALILHLLFLGWVLLGWLLTRRRPWLRWAHIASLLYGIVIETGPWPCPLTLLENYFLERAGIAPYREPFLVHYLEAVVYPDVSPALLT